jgi:hypothetical protein
VVRPIDRVRFNTVDEAPARGPLFDVQRLGAESTEPEEIEALGRNLMTTS